MNQAVIKFKEEFLIEFKIRLNSLQQEMSYIQLLPEDFRELNNENDDQDKNYYHPINWLIKGCAGAQAFMIGKAYSSMDSNKNKSEKNFYPPVLTNNFSEIGYEYIYSQVAIVIVDKNNVDEAVLSWLRKWSDDPRYFRKTIISDYSSNEIKDIAKYIVEKILYPWQSIKFSIDNGESQFNLFEDGEDESE